MLKGGYKLAESEVHIQMKHWIANKYVKQGVLPCDILFEKLLYFNTYAKKVATKYLRHTAADVFIKNNGNTAIYCQCSCNSLWLKAFIEKRIPIVRENCSHVIIVVPANLEILYPVLYQRFYRELIKEGVEVIVSPLSLNVMNKSKVPIEMPYRALEKLCNLRNKYSPDKSVINFIESDLERLVKKSCNHR